MGATTGTGFFQFLNLFPIFFLFFIPVLYQPKRIYTDPASLSSGSFTFSMSFNLSMCKMVDAPEEDGKYIGLNLAPSIISSAVYEVRATTAFAKPSSYAFR